MKERALINAVHRKLPADFFKQGMTGAAMTGNGIPDYYYDGERRDLWVEYKSLKAMPRNRIAVGDYTALQIRWLTRRWTHGRNAIGIVGLPNRTACIQTNPTQWAQGTGVETAMNFKDIAAWIYDFCT